MSDYRIRQTSQFKKDLKRLIKQGKDISKLAEMVDELASGKALSEKHKDHTLGSNWADYRDCHIEPDWVLIYKKQDDLLILTLTRSGSHADLGL